MKSTIVQSALLAGLVALVGGVAAAQPPEGRRHGPPPEAFDACESQDEGSICEFESPRGDVEGTCRTPRGDRLVCVPNDHPHPRGHPPAE